MTLISAFDFTYKGKLYKKGDFLDSNMANLPGAKFVNEAITAKIEPKIEIIKGQQKPKVFVEIKKGRGRPRKG
jgi:hypothetical protein